MAGRGFFVFRPFSSPDTAATGPLKVSGPWHSVVAVAANLQVPWLTAFRGQEKCGGYTTARKNGKTVAGIMQKAEDQAAMPDLWSTYLRSDDADAAVASNGGQVYLEPMDVPEQGHMALFGDTTGAAIDGPDDSSFGKDWPPWPQSHGRDV